jgi:hypothetical protein
MNTIHEKACKKCRQTKPADDFYENKYSPDGRYAFCKVCFDQFSKKLTDKVHPPAPPKKTCKKCGKARLINEFNDLPDNPDSKNDWCKECLKQLEVIKKQPDKKETKPVEPTPKIQKPESRDLPEKESKPQKPVEQPEQKTTPEPVRKPDLETAEKPTQEKALKPEPLPAQEPHQEGDDDFDFIEHLLETQALENRLRHETLQIPKQITKIKSRKRVCNGCGKIEEIDQVEKNTVIPVHAWFCDFCQQRGTKRLLKKRMTVQDYWGREFKVKKIISDELVMGVLKNHNGKWEKKPLKIYGNWKTP